MQKKKSKTSAGITYPVLLSLAWQHCTEILAVYSHLRSNRLEQRFDPDHSTALIHFILVLSKRERISHRVLLLLLALTSSICKHSHHLLFPEKSEVSTEHKITTAILLQVILNNVYFRHNIVSAFVSPVKIIKNNNWWISVFEWVAWMNDSITCCVPESGFLNESLEWIQLLTCFVPEGTFVFEWMVWAN